MVMSALVVGGFTTAQVAPKRALVGLSRPNQATTARGTLTGEVCQPQEGPPEAKVTVFLDESNAGGPGKQIRSATVPRNGRYRFTSVVQGSYLLVGQWLGSPRFQTGASVWAGQTEVVNLPTCIPTTGVAYKPASAAAVRQFLAEATRGDDRAFSATYRYLGGEIYGTEQTGQTFSFAQKPHGHDSIYPWGAGDFAYRAQKGGESLEFIQRVRHDYECVRNTPATAWSCEGPNNRSIGNALAVLGFDEQVGILRDMPLPTKDAAMSSGTLNGLKVTCLRFQESDGSQVTWCITASDITAFAAAENIDNVEILTLSPSLIAGTFSLPARPVKWYGYTGLPT